MTPAWAIYVSAFASAGALSWALTPIAMRFAIGHGVYDQPGGHKSHVSPVPYLGGLAIAAAFALTVLGAAALQGLRHEVVVTTMGILGVAIGLAGVGLVDDLRGLSVQLRIAAQALAGLAVWYLDAGLTLFPTDALDVVGTVVWVVLITNAFNLLDNMDGLSAGVAGIAATSFFVISVLEGQVLVASLAAALAGVTVGFLRHNSHPARIYMGDAGSLFLGFLLAVIAMKLRVTREPGVIAWAIPFVVLGVALLDTTLVVLCRKLHGLSPFKGGRDHISHRLVFAGLSVRSAVRIVYAVALSFGWLAVTLVEIQPLPGTALIAFILTGTVTAGVILGQLPVYGDGAAPAGRDQVLDLTKADVPVGSRVHTRAT